MSHQPERKEKNCLNCGTQVHGRFCHVCGQENVVTHQSFLSLARHFVYDVLHFDGKFFHTLLYIFTRPGFVAKEYVAGRRMSYLDPIRMYLFTSAFFFLLFFSLNKIHLNEGNTSGWLSNKDRREMAEGYRESAEDNPADSVLLKRIPLLLDTAKPLNVDSLGWRENLVVIGRRSYPSVQAYDSVQAALPKGEQDNWLARWTVKKGIVLSQKYRSGEKIGTILLESFLHRLPYLLFVSLPFFALILKLLYTRRKNFYYSDHAVFTLYHYIFSFILLLLMAFVLKLREWSGWGIFGFLLLALVFSWPVYLYLEMKRFYGQGKGKTVGKFLLLNMAGFFILILLFILFFIFSLYQL